MEDIHRERITSNLNILVEKTKWNCVLEEKLLFYKVFNSKMMEDITKVGLVTPFLFGTFFHKISVF